MNRLREGSEREGLRERGAAWLLVPLSGLAFSTRLLLLALCSGAGLLWSLSRNRAPGAAWNLPDVRFYQDMAHGRYSLVPQPFTSRVLAPWMAATLGRVFHTSIEAGFTTVAIVAVVGTLVVVNWLLLDSVAPVWMLLLVNSVPFWPQLLGYAGLPDPLYTALLAGLLLALQYRRWLMAALLMLPLMLAREATSLTLVCLVLCAWREMRWRGVALAVGCAGVGMAIVHRLSQAGLPNPEHLSGGLYMTGKLVSNLLRAFGIAPWSNVYPYLCATPVWATSLALGGVRSVGFCSWSPGGPLQAAWALFTVFGTLVAVSMMLALQWRRRRPHLDVLERFCLLYGGLSLLLAPMLGTWFARLFAYGWPLFLVAVPRLFGRWQQMLGAESGTAGWVLLLVVQLVLCWCGAGVPSRDLLVTAGGLQIVAMALIWRQIREYGSSR